MNGMPTTDEQYAQAARWASLLWQAGYPTELHGTGEAAPFHQEWRVFSNWNGGQVATIDIDGCGASWHGDDKLWLRVIGPSEDLIDTETYEALIETRNAYWTQGDTETVETLGREAFGLGY